MKMPVVTACVALLVLVAGCQKSNPVTPTAVVPSFELSNMYGGSHQLLFRPNVDVTLAQVVVVHPNNGPVDTVRSADPARVYYKGRWYAVEGLVVESWNEGEVWRCQFTGTVLPTGAAYSAPAEAPMYN